MSHKRATLARLAHGYSAYCKGCRCTVCRSANAEHQRQYRADPDRAARERERQRERTRIKYPNGRVQVSRDVIHALRFIAGMTGDSPNVWLTHYQQHGGGYEGLQAVARCVLESEGR